MNDYEYSIQHSCLHCDRDVDAIGSPFGPICAICRRFDGMTDRLVSHGRTTP